MSEQWVILVIRAGLALLCTALLSAEYCRLRSLVGCNASIGNPTGVTIDISQGIYDVRGSYFIPYKLERKTHKAR